MKKRFFPASMAISFFLLITLFVSSSLAAPWGDFRQLVKDAGPAVVNINTERTENVSNFMHPGIDMFRGVPEMDRFLDEFEQFAGPRTRKSNSLGSGFLISTDGFIVTNNHVVEGADSIQVSMGSAGKENTYPATVIGTDPMTDIALIKIEGKDLPVLKFGDSDKLEVGEWVIAIGSPLGLDHTVTAGIISAKGRSIQSGPYDDFLQTDASINRGNSGGPLLNMNGEVVGINTAIAQRAQGIGFAIPSNMAKDIIEQLRDHKKVSRGWLGVTIQNIDTATAKALDLESTNGVLVNNVLEKQPADAAGIKSGDIILSINSKDIDNTETLVRNVADIPPGQTVPITILRDGKKMTMDITVAERDAGDGKAVSSKDNKENSVTNKIGISVRAVNKNDVTRYRLPDANGVFVSGVEPSGLAASVGVAPGDVILAVNNVKVNSVDEFSAQVDKAVKERGAILLHLSRKGQLFFRGIEIKDN